MFRDKYVVREGKSSIHNAVQYRMLEIVLVIVVAVIVIVDLDPCYESKSEICFDERLGVDGN